MNVHMTIADVLKRTYSPIVCIKEVLLTIRPEMYLGLDLATS